MPLEYPNYEGQKPGDLALFVNQLHLGATLHQESYEDVKILSFHNDHDRLAGSGLVPQLRLDDPDAVRPPGSFGQAANACHRLLARYGHPDAIPARRWFSAVVVMLFRQCVNVETIEVPPEWVMVEWRHAFPKVDFGSIRQLESGRWRWGKDY